MFSPVIRRSWMGIYAKGVRMNSTSGPLSNILELGEALKNNSKPSKKNTLRDLLSSDNMKWGSMKTGTNTSGPGLANRKAMTLQMETEVKGLKQSAESNPLYNSNAKIQVAVKNGATSLAQDLKLLQRIVVKNQVIVELREQRYHIRPGRKKRLDRAKKHRVLFKEGFKRLLNIVKDAKRKGY